MYKFLPTWSLDPDNQSNLLAPHKFCWNIEFLGRENFLRIILVKTSLILASFPPQKDRLEVRMTGLRKFPGNSLLSGVQVRFC